MADDQSIDAFVAGMGGFKTGRTVDSVPTGEEILAGMEAAVAALRKAKRLVICHPDVKDDLIERIRQEGLAGMVEVRGVAAIGRDQVYVMPLRWGKFSMFTDSD